MAALHLRLPNDVADQLDNLVVTTGLSKSFLARKAIIDFVSREQNLMDYRQQGLTAWEDFLQTGEHATGEEASVWMKRLAQGEKVEPPKCHR